MAYININNQDLVSFNSTTIAGWTIGSSNAWVPSLVAPDNHGVYANYSTPSTGNTFSQTGVFTDFGTGALHKIKVNCTIASGSGNVIVKFGSVTAGTITSTGVQYFTASAATNATLTFETTAGLIVLDYIKLADIDVVTGVQDIVPVYNQNWLTVSSTKSSQPNFEYIFDIYTGATIGSSYLSRIKMQPYPDGSGYVYFSPFRVLESYLSFDKGIQSITTGTASQDHITPYLISIGEAYGSTLTGQTIYSAQTIESGYTFNGVVSYEFYPDWLYTDYDMGISTSGATRLFLTKQPSITKIKNTTDRGTLTLLDTTNTPNYFKVVVYHNDGSTSAYTYMNQATTATTSDNITHIPAGIYNLNNLTATGATGTIINICNDTKYTIQIFKGATAVSEIMTYEIDSKYSKFDTTRLQFKNSLGGFDYMNFTLTNKQSLKADRKSFQKPLAHNYRVGDRGASVYNLDAEYTNSINTDWLNDSESLWMEELILSSEVNIIESDGTSIPIVLDTESIEILRSINKKMISYTIKYKPANKINTVRA